MQEAKPEIIYAFDPLCGWCYGFNPVVTKLRAKFASRAGWRIMSGGLVTGDRVRPIREMKDYLKNGMSAVTARTGQQFGEGFLRLLDEGDWISRSEPACRAVFVVQREWPNVAMNFAQELCASFYKAGLKPDEPDTLAVIAKGCGIDAESLINMWSSEAALLQTSEEFAHARLRGITSYPALYLATEAGIKCLVEGYASYEQAYASLLKHIPQLIDTNSTSFKELAI